MPHRMYFEVHDTGFAARAQSSDISDLHALYLLACRDGQIPALADFDINQLARFSPFLMRLEPVEDGSFRYAYYGSGIKAVALFDMLGKTTADFEGPVRSFFENVYKRSSETGVALFTIHRAIKAQLIHTWERLILPVRMASGQIAFVVYNKPREFEQDFLQSIMHALPDGIVALRGMRDQDGHLIDANIVSANRAASQILGTPAERLGSGTFRSAVPMIFTSDVWNAVVAVIHHREQKIIEIAHDHGGETRYLKLQITALFDGALLHISDITTLKMVNLVLAREQEQLKVEISRHRSEGDILRGLAHSDALTGVLNRRGLFAVTGEWTRRHRGVQSSILTVDIDRFKAVNDRYGHGVGDKVIERVATVLMAMAGKTDGVVARPGGDEFVCVLPASLDEAMTLAERVRADIAMVPIQSPLGPVMFTCSIGASAWQEGQSFDIGLQEADAALYLAKSQGRNRVTTNSETVDRTTKTAKAHQKGHA